MKRMTEYFTADNLGRYVNDANNPSSMESDVPEEVEHVRGYISRPVELDRQLLEELVDLVNQAGHYTNKASGKVIGPDTIDRILDADWVAYVLSDAGLPIAAVTLVNTSEEGWTGAIPRNYYELKIGKSLGNRRERRVFTLGDDYTGTNVGRELERIIQEQSTNIYAVSILEQPKDTEFLVSMGYTLIGNFDSELTDNFLGVWIIESDGDEL